MKKLPLILLLITTVSYASEVTLLFSSDEQMNVSVDSLAWSRTITDMLEDLGVDSGMRVPINNFSRATFLCLLELMIETRDPLILTDKKLPISELREKFAKKLRDPIYQNINYHDLYLATFFFDMHNKFKNVIASFYVDSFNGELPELVSQGDTLPPLFDGMSAENHRFIAGWLLHNLLSDENMKPVFETKDFKFGSEIIFGPIISSSGSHRSFVCIWRRSDNQIYDIERGSRIPCQCLLLDLAEKGAMQGHNINGFIPYENKCFCTLSQDNKNMLLIRGGGPGKSLAYLCESSNGPVNESVTNNVSIDASQHFPFAHDINQIVSVLFDDMNKVFKVLVFSVKYDDATKEIAAQTFYCYTINPALTVAINSSVSEVAAVPLHFSYFNAMNWACVNGKLVGVSTINRSINLMSDILGEDEIIKNVLLLDEKKLRECTFDQNSDTWIYTKKDETLSEAHFSIVKTKEKPDGATEVILKQAVLRSFIPDFENVLSKKLDMIRDNLKGITSDYQVTFDPNHLHMNCIIRVLKRDTSVVGIYYPYDQKLVAAVNIINKKMLNGYPEILCDVYFLYEYYTNPRKWYVRCKDLINPKKMFISPEIQQIFGFDQLTNNPLLHAPETLAKTPVSLWNAYNPKKLWEYAKQQFQVYKKQLLYGGAAVGGTGLAAWLWHKSKNSNFGTNLIRPVSQPSVPAVSIVR